jgi:ABC-type branched-subunit amino acid transport system ATPase component
MGTFLGPPLGAFLYLMFREIASGYTSAWQFWFGLLFMGFILFSPLGVVGLGERVMAPLRRRLRGAAAMAARLTPRPGQEAPGFLRRNPRVDGVLLEVRGLRKRFGGFTAVDNVDLQLADRRLHALIGPNGAGKTTLINLLTGVLRPDRGEVMLGPERVTHLPPHARVKRGLARTFQVNALFAGLTVLESVTLAICERRGEARHWLRPLSTHQEALAEAHELLRSLDLDGDAAVLTRQLPYGKQRLVELALALAARPSVLLLDEPAAGVPSGESQALITAIERLPAETTILLIEHDMSLVFRFARRITVLAAGRVVTEGSAEAVSADERVRELYLGSEAHG